MARVMQFGLFIFWPIIACLLMFAVAVMCAAAWLLIPFGTPTEKDGTWSLRFPWNKSSP